MHAMPNVKEIIVSPEDKMLTVHYANGHIESVQCETLTCQWMNNSTTMRANPATQWLEIHIQASTAAQLLTRR